MNHSNYEILSEKYLELQKENIKLQNNLNDLRKVIIIFCKEVKKKKKNGIKNVMVIRKRVWKRKNITDYYSNIILDDFRHSNTMQH